MNYFGIKPPLDEDGNERPIWWIAQHANQAWIRFLGTNSNRPIDEAIRAYESIGYRCVELDVREKAAPA